MLWSVMLWPAMLWSAPVPRTPSRAVDWTRPPSLGWGGPAPLRCVTPVGLDEDLWRMEKIQCEVARLAERSEPRHED